MQPLKPIFHKYLMITSEILQNFKGVWKRFDTTVHLSIYLKDCKMLFYFVGALYVIFCFARFCFCSFLPFVLFAPLWLVQTRVYCKPALPCLFNSRHIVVPCVVCPCGFLVRLLLDFGYLTCCYLFGFVCLKWLIAVVDLRLWPASLTLKVAGTVLRRLSFQHFCHWLPPLIVIHAKMK